VGLLGVATRLGYARQVEALRAGLGELGYVEGRNLAIDERWANDDLSRLPDLATELVRLRPDVLVTSGPGARHLRDATAAVPIVMAAAGDVVENGLVKSLAHPGGNLTGSSFQVASINAKRLELLKEALPRVRNVCVLRQRGAAANAAITRAMDEAARPMGVTLQYSDVAAGAEIPAAIRAAADGRAEALIVSDATIFVAQAARIAETALAQRLPVIGPIELAEAGGLLAYGVDFVHLWRRAATFIDRILRGARPADLPVEQPTRFRYAVNVRTAQTLRVAIPPALLARATPFE
jgi:putative ABC transport system substrate-binding protein